MRSRVKKKLTRILQYIKSIVATEYPSANLIHQHEIYHCSSRCIRNGKKNMACGLTVRECVSVSDCIIVTNEQPCFTYWLRKSYNVFNGHSVLNCIENACKKYIN